MADTKEQEPNTKSTLGQITERTPVYIKSVVEAIEAGYRKQFLIPLPELTLSDLSDLKDPLSDEHSQFVTHFRVQKDNNDLIVRITTNLSRETHVLIAVGFKHAKEKTEEPSKEPKLLFVPLVKDPRYPNECSAVKIPFDKTFKGILYLPQSPWDFDQIYGETLGDIIYRSVLTTIDNPRDVWEEFLKGKQTVKLPDQIRFAIQLGLKRVPDYPVEETSSLSPLEQE